MLTHVKATEYLNPGQTPVMAGDLKIYMSMKKCQHMYPEEVGEDKIVCFMGFLHKEMAAQECGGVLLGWIWLGTDFCTSQYLHIRHSPDPPQWKEDNTHTTCVSSDISMASHTGVTCLSRVQ